MASMIPGHA